MRGPYAVVVPCFNVEATVSELLRRCAPFVSPADIFCVDDGSSDRTGICIRESGARLLIHDRNRGKGAALRTGFVAVVELGYDGAVTMDADLQHTPEHLPEFFRVAGDFDILVGTRAYHLRNMPFDRWLTNHTTSLVVSWLSGTRLHDSQSGYRYLSRRVMRDVPLSASRYDMESEQLIRAGRMGMRIGEVPIDTLYTDSRSYIHPVRDTLRFIRMALRNLCWRPPVPPSVVSQR